MWRIAGVSFLLLLLAGCGSTPMPEPQPEPVAPPQAAASPGPVPLSDPDATRAALLQQYWEWVGVPYRYGGNSRHGIDCSGFAQITFQQYFGVSLPRDSGSQRRIGRPVAPSLLAPGDLLFFATGPREGHVGIYVGKQKFLHVSSSSGVMLSSIHDSYWSGRLQSAVRVEES